MVREVTKVVYRPSAESNEDYILIVNPEEVRNASRSDLQDVLTDVDVDRVCSTSDGRVEVCTLFLSRLDCS